MKFILAANTMEQGAFAAFLEEAATDHPDAAFIVCGDLLNVFPEPGEDMESSIFYEIYGDLLPREMDLLRRSHFRHIASSGLIEPLHEMFDPGGRTQQQAITLATARYAQVFTELTQVLGNHQLFYVPGNMDYPQITARFAKGSDNITQLDCEITTVDGVRLAGVGGIPRSCQPFAEVAAISPYELADSVYERNLAAVWGADILVTHPSPEECPALEAFVRDSPVRLVICRAPFSFKALGSCRGTSRCTSLAGKTVVHVRPFEYPENLAFVLDFSADPRTPPVFEIYGWNALATKTPQRVLHAPI